MNSLIGKSEILEKASDYLHDESRFTGGIPSKLFFPETIDDVQTIVKQACLTKTPIVLIGARSGTTAGAVPVDGCFAVSFSSMDRILSVKKISSGEVVLVCQPGVTLATIQSFCEDPSSYRSSVPGSELIGKNQYFYPPDPTELSAQLGGTVACNASGARSFRFGATRHYIDSCLLITHECDIVNFVRGKNPVTGNGFRIKTESGAILSIPPVSYVIPQVKNAAGYYCKPDMDCIDLIIGSEGTLGAIVEIGIILKPVKNILSALSFFPSRDAAFRFARTFLSEQSVVSIEYFDSSSLDFVNRHRDAFSDRLPSFPENCTTAILWEWCDNDPDSFEINMEMIENNLQMCGSSFEKTWSGFDFKEQEVLKKFRHALPEAINMTVAQNKLIHSDIRKIGTDSAVPAEHFERVFTESVSLIEMHGIAYAAFGHLGDFHIHFNLLPASKLQLDKSLEVYDQLMEMAISCGGTVSAEHGIGKLKKKYMSKMFNGEAIKQMQAVKNAFDPYGIFNPENLL